MAQIVQTVGETTLTGKNQISLPVQGVRHLGWERGDKLVVQLLGEDVLVLRRRPENWADAYAGKLGHVFGTHDETIAFLEAERDSWGADAPGHTEAAAPSDTSDATAQ